MHVASPDGDSSRQGHVAHTTKKERELAIQSHDTINFHLFSTPIDLIKAMQQKIQTKNYAR
jgi:hypothetical protein